MKSLFWAMWDVSRLGTAGPARVIRNRALRRTRGFILGRTIRLIGKAALIITALAAAITFLSQVIR